MLQEGPGDKGKLCSLGRERARPTTLVNKGCPHGAGGGGAARSEAGTASGANGVISGRSQPPCGCDLAGGLGGMTVTNLRS